MPSPSLPCSSLVLAVSALVTVGCGDDDSRGAPDGSGGTVLVGPAGGWVSTTGGGMGTGGTPATDGATNSGGASSSGGGSTEHFSFFVTSLEAMQQLSGSADGFGGDLRFGEATGLAGADKICQTIATNEGFGNKTWRAFLSTSTEDAIDRVGTGPWYDRLGRRVANDVEGLLGDRPDGEASAINDLPNEEGVQEHTLDPQVDDHDTLTGSDEQGRLAGSQSTCSDWTSTGSGRPMAGHSWPGGPSRNWMSAHAMSGCAPGVNLAQQMGGPGGGDACVGCEGGYGGIYCFALTP